MNQILKVSYFQVTTLLCTKEANFLVEGTEKAILDLTLRKEIFGLENRRKACSLIINDDICFPVCLLIISCGQLWFQETGYLLSSSLAPLLSNWFRKSFSFCYLCTMHLYELLTKQEARYNLCPIQFVPDTICARYSLCPIQFVSDTNCAETNCADTFCADTICSRYNLCRYNLYMYRKKEGLEPHIAGR